MHFGDYTFIIILALVLFGPKRLPEIARQAGRLMMEFRRASNEFKMQMDEELRHLEEEDRRKKYEAEGEAAGNSSRPYALPDETDPDYDTPVISDHLATSESEEDDAQPEHSYTPPAQDEECVDPVDLLDQPNSRTEKEDDDFYADHYSRRYADESLKDQVYDVSEHEETRNTEHGSTEKTDDFETSVTSHAETTSSEHEEYGPEISAPASEETRPSAESSSASPQEETTAPEPSAETEANNGATTAPESSQEKPLNQSTSQGPARPESDPAIHHA